MGKIFFCSALFLSRLSILSPRRAVFMGFLLNPCFLCGKLFQVSVKPWTENQSGLLPVLCNCSLTRGRGKELWGEESNCVSVAVLLGGANDERQDYDPVVSSAVPPLPAHPWLICSLGIVICEAGIVSCCVQVWHNETLKWGCWCLVKANRERRRALDPILSVSPGAQSWTWSIKVLLVLNGRVIMVITFLYGLRKYFGAIMVLFPRLCMPSYDCCCSYKSGRFSV